MSSRALSLLVIAAAFYCEASARADKPAPDSTDELAPVSLGDVEPLEPVLPTGAAVTLAGTTVRINGCDVLDVYEGPEALSPAMLLWDRPSSRREWLQSQLDRAVARYDDPWEAFVELGGGVRQTTSGFSVLARVTDRIQDCDGFLLPVLDVLEVHGAWDLDRHRPTSRAVEPLAPEGLDVDDPELRRVLDAAESAGEEGSETLVIDVEGVTDLSLGCPPWALVESRSVTFNCAARRGFIDVQYADPELAPDADEILFGLLLERGEKYIDDVRGSTAERLRERADWAARRGPYRYEGRFTGEVSLHRGTEALFLTPVFVVESRIDPDPEDPHPLSTADR